MEDIDTLVRKQEETGQQITKLYANIKKDSASRKTLEYFQSRIATLKNYGQDVEKRHKQLLEISEPTHVYMTSNYYDELRRVYETTKKYIIESMKNLEEESGNGSTQPEEKVLTKICLPEENQDPQQLRLKRQQLRINQLRQTIIRIHNELPEQNIKSHFVSLQQRLDEQWNAVYQLNEDICIYEKDFKSKYFTEDQYGKIEQEVYDTRKALEKEIEKTTIQQKEEKPYNIPLPPVQIPIFKGDYEQWTIFQNLFQEIIHTKKSLSNIEKMHYLKTHLQGEASRVIQHLSISDNNYEAAWKLLTSRYDNKRLIIAKLLDKIIDFPPILQESAEKIKRLHDTVAECLQAISNLNVDTTTWGPMIARIVTRKWDPESNKLYEQSLENSHEVQDQEDLMKFLQKRFQSLESMGNTNEKTQIQASKKYTAPPCICCNEHHRLPECPKFQQMSPQQRNRVIRENRRCINCLGTHDLRNCYDHRKCRYCQRRHHTLLHCHEQRPKETGQPPRRYQREQPREANQRISNNIARKEETVLLATALIQAKKADGTQEIVRALIDTGSQVSLITEQAAQLLALPREKVKAEISGLGDGEPRKSNTKIEAQLAPRFTSDFKLNTTLLVLPKLTQTLPKKQLENNLQEWENRMLADPTFAKPGPIDLILGAKDISTIIMNGIHKTKSGIMGQNTEFGWILSGTSNELQTNNIDVVSMVTSIEEDKQLTKFWELEDISIQREQTEEEKACEHIYKQTTTRDTEGRYVVRLPFKRTPELGTSRPRAIARLLQQEKKFERNTELKQQYQSFMEEYIRLGHMQAIPKNEEHQGKYYIPHQAVIKEDSTTTKLRVVFDASSKTSTGQSLNDNMHTGPRLQQELTDILLRWRTHKIVFSADVEKMYRQIKVHPEDQQYQNIIWRSDPAKPVQEYKLTTVTYGTTAAPYLAVKTLQQLAIDEAKSHPEASKITKRDFYVDDLLSGADTEQEAIQLQNQVRSMLLKGGFSLRKWSSNSKQVLESLPEELQEHGILDFVEETSKKSLGIHWIPKEDVFIFKPPTMNQEAKSKRSILSEISKLYDPLGWLAPVVIQAKILIQQLWLHNLEWDDNIPADIYTQWSNFQQQLNSISSYQIPRWTQHQTNSKIQLHGFCDASEKAYGAAVYSRVITENNDVVVQLLIAKSKVAPARTRTTLPRLELCAAELLARLIKKVINALELQFESVYAWTDSMIALGWIKGEPQRWKTFVANRVARIQTILHPNQWLHVSTHDNPADAISRGMDPTQLKTHSIWWNGPVWLSSNQQWPIQDIIDPVQDEIRLCHQITISTTSNDIIPQFSTLTRMLRVLTYCRRFTNACRKRTTHQGYLSSQELQTTLEQIIKITQAQEFAKELKILETKQHLPNQHKLASLNPFTDKNMILRVGGRLQHSQLPYDEKHPIILPAKCHLSTLIIKSAHITTLHGGNQMTAAYIRRKYWLINGRKAISYIIHKCVTCTRYKAHTCQQLMGELPAPRITPSHPFAHTGVDYAGPIQIRTTKGRGNKSYKGYIVVLVCLATRAIHLEAVSDMTTDAFIAAYRRFVARRGPCAHLYSDNGTTFIGASKILRQLPEQLSTIGTQWHFIPPAAPHFGGLWESGVKSMKYHLRRIIGTSTLTFEELTTLLCQIEACLNSRPLCPLSEEINDITTLTPGHFLIGQALLSPIISAEQEITGTTLSRWRLIQKLKNDFWKIWASEYLGRLQQRRKWKKPSPNINPGELVLIKDETIHPAKWPLAKIAKVHPGSDGIIRVATIQQAGGTTLQRPIHKLIPLPTKPEINISQDAVTNPTPPIHHRRNTSNTNHSALIFLLFLVNMITRTTATYNIRYPPPGLYVENMGTTQIDRGVFQIQLRFEINKVGEDAEAVSSILSQMEQLCDDATKLTKETQCEHWMHHLEEQNKQFQWLKEGLQEVLNNRQKRGVLGKLLTSIFGVNDEVYHDIDTLDKNQQELIKASNHQTKFMLKALATFNDTENRINNRLEKFRNKLNEGVEAIKQMKKWYKTIDENKLNIHIINAVTIASTYLEETIKFYSNIVDLHYNRGHIYQLISPMHVKKILTTAATKIPSFISILPTPLLKTEVKHDNNSIQIMAYFPLAEATTFTVVKITPIPHHIAAGFYWIMRIPSDILAIDYDTQQYFQLTDSELRDSIYLQEHKYLCSPLVVRNLDTNPNCIINELYQRKEPPSCPIQNYTVQALTWKQMYMENTWMFVTQTTTRIAIICSGNREEVSLNASGLIQIEQNCIIQTKQNILSAKRMDHLPVLEGLFRPVPFHINTTIEFHTIKPLTMEPVIKVSDQLQSLKQEEENNQLELNERHWKTIHHHSTISSGITTLGILIVCAAIWYGYQHWKNKPAATSEPIYATIQRPPRTAHISDASEIELQRLHDHAVHLSTVSVVDGRMSNIDN